MALFLDLKGGPNRKLSIFSEAFYNDFDLEIFCFKCKICDKCNLCKFFSTLDIMNLSPKVGKITRRLNSHW